MLQNIESKSKSTILKKKCPFCSKTAQTIHEEIDGSDVVTRLNCGHTIITPAVTVDTTWKHKSISGKEPFPYQYETVERAERASFRCIFNHDTGVGKTICVCLTIAKHKEMLLPAVIFVKSSLKTQWFKELLDWTGIPAQIIDSGRDKPYPELFKIFIISYDTVKNLDWIPKLNLKLAVLDECQQIKNSQAKRTQAIRTALSGKVKRERIYNPDLKKREKIKVIASDLMKYHGIDNRFKLNFEELPENKLGLCECRAAGEGIISGQITIDRKHAENDSEDDVIDTILHEISHAITPGAGHKPIWSKTCSDIGGSGLAIASCNGSESFKDGFEFPAIPYVIPMSATPVKNHMGEYFPALNLTRPDIFPSQALYEREFCEVYSSGWGYKVGGLSDKNRFDEVTKNFIIGYRREEVLPDLPKVFRKYLYVELPQELKAAYIKAWEDWKEAYEDKTGNSFENTGNIIAKLGVLRHLVGIAKIIPVSEHVEEFLEANNKQKIVLFVHHKAVGLGLHNHLMKMTERMNLKSPVSLTSENASSPEGIRINERFMNDPDTLIMIASTLSAGEGKNWQMCHESMMVERQWNPANEEQPEGRFMRPCPQCGAKCICGLVGDKVGMTYPIVLGTTDEILTEIIEDKRKKLGNVEWNESQVLKEMMEQLYTRGISRFKL